MLRVCIAVLISIFCLSCTTKKRPILGKSDYQIKQNAIFKDASKSPLKKKDLKNFKGLEFFPIDSNYIIKAKLTRIDNAPVFEMPTTTDRKPLYKEFGVVKFSLMGKECELTIYQSQDDLEDEKYKDYLFLPFTDETSGDESYGGGRYMDLLLTDINEDDTIVLNFNNTYNPYCAYNHMFSCPLTPRKNHLNIPVKAGIKIFKKVEF